MDEPPTDFSYRSLELICRRQAVLASTAETRLALEMMAAEYRKLADQEEHLRPEPEEVRLDDFGCRLQLERLIWRRARAAPISSNAGGGCYRLHALDGSQRGG